jgi:putative membrane protein
MLVYNEIIKGKRKTFYLKPIIFVLILGVLFLISGTVVGDSGDHMDGDGMMGWGVWGSSLMWFWMIGYWIVFVIIGALIYKDAESRKMNGLLWFALVILPWIGILFLIIYLIVREDKTSRVSPQKSANTILDERYARGEITQEDYKRMRRDISD